MTFGVTSANMSSANVGEPAAIASTHSFWPK